MRARSLSARLTRLAAAQTASLSGLVFVDRGGTVELGGRVFPSFDALPPRLGGYLALPRPCSTLDEWEALVAAGGPMNLGKTPHEAAAHGRP